MKSFDNRIWTFSTVYFPYQVGGAEKSALEISKYLRSKGFLIKVFTVAPPKMTKMNRIDVYEELPSGIEVFAIRRLLPYISFFDKKKRPLLLRALWHLLDFFSLGLFCKLALKYFKDRNGRPQYIFTHNLTGLGFTPWVFAGLFQIPIIHIVHDYNLLCFKNTRWRRSQNCTSICFTCKPRAFASKFLVKKVKKVIGVSKSVLFPHVKYLNLKTESLGIAYGNTSIKSNQKANSEFDFGFIGNISEEKGFETFLSAARLTNYTFAVAGHATSEQINRISELSNVHYLGWSDPESFYKKVGCVIVPSLWEDPAPKVIYEAGWAGAHVIVSDRSSLVEIAQYHELEYEVFKAGDYDDLVIKMKHVHEKGPVTKSPKMRKMQGEQVLELIVSL